MSFKDLFQAGFANTVVEDGQATMMGWLQKVPSARRRHVALAT